MAPSIHANTPRYLADRVSAYVPSRSLRSSDQSLLVVPMVNLERFGRRAFSCAGPSLWNSLPLVLRTEQDGERFRRDAVCVSLFIFLLFLQLYNIICIMYNVCKHIYFLNHLFTFIFKVGYSALNFYFNLIYSFIQLSKYVLRTIVL